MTTLQGDDAACEAAIDAAMSANAKPSLPGDVLAALWIASLALLAVWWLIASNVAATTTPAALPADGPERASAITQEASRSVGDVVDVFIPILGVLIAAVAVATTVAVVVRLWRWRRSIPATVVAERGGLSSLRDEDERRVAQGRSPHA
jgi:hypothetical protein